MLYNGNWDKTTLTLESFSAWLHQQPAEKSYRFTDIGRCAVAQYLESRGHEPIMSCERLEELGWMKVVCAPGHHTFGEAAMRARLHLRGGWRLRVAKFFGRAGML
jgi:hypothetical protein